MFIIIIQFVQVTQLCHFDYVRLEDLERIGLGRPAARRLQDAVKKRRSAAWRKAVVAKLLPGVGGSSSSNSSGTAHHHNKHEGHSDVPGGHTSLIQEKVRTCIDSIEYTVILLLENIHSFIIILL